MLGFFKDLNVIQFIEKFEDYICNLPAIQSVGGLYILVGKL